MSKENIISEKPAKDYIRAIAAKFIQGKKITEAESVLIGWYPFFNLEEIYGHNNIRSDSSI